MATTNLSYYDKETIPNAKKFRFGIVVSEWNPSITEGLFKGAVNTLLDCGVEEINIKTIHVPGSFELVFGAKIASKYNYDAIICLGSVIKGETDHFDYICNAVS